MRCAARVYMYICIYTYIRHIRKGFQNSFGLHILQGRVSARVDGLRFVGVNESHTHIHVYICIYICIYIYIYIHIYIYLYIYINICRCEFSGHYWLFATQLFPYMYTCTYKLIYTDIQRACVCIYIFRYELPPRDYMLATHLYNCMYTCIHVYTHIHICICM